jgi:hypothetical protein
MELNISKLLKIPIMSTTLKANTVKISKIEEFPFFFFNGKVTAIFLTSFVDEDCYIGFSKETNSDGSYIGRSYRIYKTYLNERF